MCFTSAFVYIISVIHHLYFFLSDTMTKSRKSRDMKNDLIRENDRESTYHPVSQFLVRRL